MSIENAINRRYFGVTLACFADDVHEIVLGSIESPASVIGRDEFEVAMVSVHQLLWRGVPVWIRYKSGELRRLERKRA